MTSPAPVPINARGRDRPTMRRVTPYPRCPLTSRRTARRVCDRAVGGGSAGDGHLEGLGLRCAAEGVVGVDDGLEREAVAHELLRCELALGDQFPRGKD